VSAAVRHHFIHSGWLRGVLAVLFSDSVADTIQGKCSSTNHVDCGRDFAYIYNHAEMFENMIRKESGYKVLAQTCS
jgi:hypothetical protein